MSVDGVVLVHGSNLSAACWDPVVEHLATPTVAVDLPGRGSRPADISTVTLDACVGAVIDAADEAKMDRFVLVGHSLGGVVITQTAVRYAPRVARLVYVGALVPALRESAADLIFGEDLPEAEPRVTTEDRAKMFFGNDMTLEQWADVWQQFVPESPRLWNARLSGYPGVPITYVSMVDDIGVPPELVARMLANLGPDVDHRVVQAGHLVMITRPKELAGVINDLVNC